MKSLNLPKESQKALLNGSNMFLEPCDRSLNYEENYCRFYNYNDIGNKVFHEINEVSSYRIGDEFHFDSYKIIIKDIKVVKVQDIEVNFIMYMFKTLFEKEGLLYIVNYFKEWYNEQYKNYEDNPYVFLYKIERLYK